MLMLSMFSCTDINKQLEEMIPADSRGVVRIDVKSVIEKGQLADEDGNVIFPQSLKDVMSKNESAPVSEAMTLLRKIGIDTDANIYCFLPKNTFSYATLIAVNDADEAKKAIEKQSGQKFQTIEKVDFLRNGAISYVIDDDILFIGKEAKEDADSKLALTAKGYLHKSSTSIAEDASITESLHKENDVNAYINVSGFHNMIANSESFTESLKKFPILTLFTDSDII